jgi:hypothetical protein
MCTFLNAPLAKPCLVRHLNGQDGTFLRKESVETLLKKAQANERRCPRLTCALIGLLLSTSSFSCCGPAAVLQLTLPVTLKNMPERARNDATVWHVAQFTRKPDYRDLGMS